MKSITTVILLFVWTTAREAPIQPVSKQKASFLIAYQIIDSLEGGYANVPNDVGGETYCGISRKFYGDWHGWSHIDEYKQKNGAPEWNYRFNDLTEWHVTDFYVDIWVKEGFCDLENQTIANYLFDFRIHSPVAVKIIQQQLKEYGYACELDNKMNPAMVDALNKIDGNSFLKSMREKRIDFYKQIADRHPSQRRFLSHWLKRANV